MKLKKIRFIRLAKFNSLYEFAKPGDRLNIAYVDELKDFVLFGAIFHRYSSSDLLINEARHLLEKNNISCDLVLVKGFVKGSRYHYHSAKFSKETEMFLLLSEPLELS